MPVKTPASKKSMAALVSPGPDRKQTSKLNVLKKAAENPTWVAKFVREESLLSWWLAVKKTLTRNFFSTSNSLQQRVLKGYAETDAEDQITKEFKLAVATRTNVLSKFRLSSLPEREI